MSRRPKSTPTTGQHKAHEEHHQAVENHIKAIEAYQNVVKVQLETSKKVLNHSQQSEQEMRFTQIEGWGSYQKTSKMLVIFYASFVEC